MRAESFGLPDQERLLARTAAEHLHDGADVVRVDLVAHVAHHLTHLIVRQVPLVVHVEALELPEQRVALLRLRHRRRLPRLLLHSHRLPRRRGALHDAD